VKGTIEEKIHEIFLIKSNAESEGSTKEANENSFITLKYIYDLLK
jgi:hypothetical protein